MRSVGLVALGAALIVVAAGLGVLLVHDGEVTHASLAQARSGDAVEVKGEPQPFFPDRLGPWSALRPLLANHTVMLETEPGLVALLTSAAPAPAGVVLAEGTVLFAGPYPGEPERNLVIVQVTAWREPLVFR